MWFNWGSNPGPSACEADVIATTLLNQLNSAGLNDVRKRKTFVRGHQQMAYRIYDR